jgi:hypothetical protein
MRFFSRVKFCSLVAVFMVFLAGSAWAEDEVPMVFTSFGQEAQVYITDGIPDYEHTEIWGNAYVNVILPSKEGEEGKTLPDNIPVTLSLDKNISVFYYDDDGYNVASDDYKTNEPIPFYIYKNKETYKNDDNEMKERYSYGPLRDENGLIASFGGWGHWWGWSYGDNYRDSSVLMDARYMISVDIPGGSESWIIDGQFGKHRTFAEQMQEKCVPYLVTSLDETGKITGLKYSFVDPDTDTLQLVSSDNIYIDQFTIWLSNSKIDTGTVTIVEQDEQGNPIPIKYSGKAETISIPTDPIDPRDVDMLMIQFHYESENQNNHGNSYAWRFSNAPTPEQPVSPDNVPTPDQPVSPGSGGSDSGNSGSDPETPAPDPVSGDGPTVILPSDDDVKQAEDDAVNNLKGELTGVSAADDVNIKTNTQVTFNTSGDLIEDRTASAISIEQIVPEGGAVVLGTVELPLASKSITNIMDLPPVENFDELKTQYSVIKGFDGGGTIDLLALYGERAFGYEKTEDGGKVVIKATIVIIDGPAPLRSEDNNIERPFANDNFGAKMSEDNKYLYIYDGNSNGTAKDPIALVLKTENSDQDNNQNNNNTDNSNAGNRGSSGGCSASSYPLILLALAGISLLIRARRNEV